MKQREKIIVGNWKMNPAKPEEAEKIFVGLTKGIGKVKGARAIICPSFIHYPLLSRLNKKKTIGLGVQNIFVQEKGSFTGEISIDMIKNMGAKYIILGHSERRKLGETDQIVNQKIQLALKAKITPIICIGEKERDHDGNYLAFIRSQLENCLHDVPKAKLNEIIIAYEPIFAIGAAEAMKSHEVHEMTIFIKKALVEIYKIKVPSTPILYGGAVDPTNAHSILTDGDADGLLVGRQSLEAKSFLEILHSAAK